MTKRWTNSLSLFFFFPFSVSSLPKNLLEFRTRVRLVEFVGSRSFARFLRRAFNPSVFLAPITRLEKLAKHLPSANKNSPTASRWFIAVPRYFSGIFSPIFKYLAEENITPLHHHQTLLFFRVLLHGSPSYHAGVAVDEEKKEASARWVFLR